MSFPSTVRSSFVCGVLALSGLPAAAQDGSSGCSTTVPPSGSTTDTPSGGPSLTQTLDDCNGVLKPPAVGDGDIVEPAPQSGETPVITPDQLPQGANPSNQPQ